MTIKLFPTYEVGSLPKLSMRVKALRGESVTDKDILELKKIGEKYSVVVEEVIDILEKQQKEKYKPTSEERKKIIDLNALLNTHIQEKCDLDFVYDGEARRNEMYRHVAEQIEGFADLPEMIRSRGPDSWRASVCVAPPFLKSIDTVILNEFLFVQKHAQQAVKVPVDDPYMIAAMSDNRYYTELLYKKYQDEPRQLRYEAKCALTLALAKKVIRPQVEAVVQHGAQWIQLDIPAATIDIEHIPIVVDGINKVVEGFTGVKFSLHMCYPRRKSLCDKRGYELLFPHIEQLEPSVNHLSLELANGDQYEKDLAPFAQSDRKFEIGVGVIDITLERQQKGLMETSTKVRDRILRAAEVLGDPKLVYVAPDCGLRQLSLERCIKLYQVMREGAELARKG